VLPQQLIDFLRDRYYANNDSIRAIAARHADDPGLVFDDVEHCDAAFDPSNYSGDCQHLNSRGFAVMAVGVLDRLAAHPRERTLSETAG
jgi:hypothetical protein